MRLGPVDEIPLGEGRAYAVDGEMSLATIEHVCDAVEVGDYLEPFALPQVPVGGRGI